MSVRKDRFWKPFNFRGASSGRNSRTAGRTRNPESPRPLCLPGETPVPDRLADLNEPFSKTLMEPPKGCLALDLPPTARGLPR
jgi:hypothetical protein